MGCHGRQRQSQDPHTLCSAQSTVSKFSVNARVIASTQDKSIDDVEDTLLAMVAKHSNRAKPHSHSGNICSVLSQPNKVDKVQIKEDETSVNGRTHGVRQAKSHVIQCNVSEASQKKQGSLIDPMEASLVLTSETWSASCVKRLTSVALTITRSHLLPSLLLELLQSANGD